MATITTLAEADIQQAEALLVEWLQTAYPNLDLSAGRVLRDLLIRPAAMFHAANTQDIDTLRRSMSLRQIALDPTLADTDTVDDVMSNLLLTRDAGQASAGQLRVILESDLLTQINAGTTFTSNGLTFTTTQAFVGVTSSRLVVNSTTRLITSRADGYYEFVIDVAADTAGAQYNLASGSRFTTTASIPNLVDIVAVNDFTGGRATQSNAELVATVQRGLAPKVLSSRAHIASLIHEQFADLVDISIIGVGDPEMRRDSGNVFGISLGGKADIYARTASTPVITAIPVAATVTDAVARRLQFTLDRDVAAGAYALLGVYRAADTAPNLDVPLPNVFIDSLPVVSSTWTVNSTTTGEFVPFIGGRVDAAFTRYQQLAVAFTDAQNAGALNSTAEYVAYVLQMPLVADIQDFINVRSRRSPAADYLVRAPIPAMCNIGVRINARQPAEVDIAAIRNQIVERVNALTFAVGYLPASVVVDAVQSLLPSDAALQLPIAMMSRLYLPDNSVVSISDPNALNAPTDQGYQVSSRTVAFFLRPADVQVSVSTLSTREV